MGSIVKLSETRCGMRKRPTKWSPDMAAAYARCYGPVSFDGENPDQTQLEMFRRQREAIERVRL